METANKDVKTDDVAAAAAAGETGPAEDAPKVIVVFGATGAQGGSVVQYMKTDESFKLRVVTRNPDSENAKALADQGRLSSSMSWLIKGYFTLLYFSWLP